MVQTASHVGYRIGQLVLEGGSAVERRRQLEGCLNYLHRLGFAFNRQASPAARWESLPENHYGKRPPFTGELDGNSNLEPRWPPYATEGEAFRAFERDLGQRASAPMREYLRTPGLGMRLVNLAGLQRR